MKEKFPQLLKNLPLPMNVKKQTKTEEAKFVILKALLQYYVLLLLILFVATLKKVKKETSITDAKLAKPK